MSYCENLFWEGNIVESTERSLKAGGLGAGIFCSYSANTAAYLRVVEHVQGPTFSTDFSATDYDNVNTSNNAIWTAIYTAATVGVFFLVECVQFHFVCYQRPSTSEYITSEKKTYC